MQVTLGLIAVNWTAVLIVAVIVIILLALYADLLHSEFEEAGPKDAVGNGINIGPPKAFDNRSLALRIERLSASLASLKVINQKVTENLSTYQGHTSTESSRTLTLDFKTGPAKGGGGSEADKGGEQESDKEAKRGGGTSSEAAHTEVKPAVGLAASDILTDQLNLASQILNLEMLYERSLSDRLIGDDARLQTVLGFQISVTPPAGYERCAAVAEVAVRARGNSTPVSLVALIPQEKTYNAQSVSSSAQSIGGSAVASVLTLGLGSKGETRQLFVHRDSDTIAFERDSRSAPLLFDGDKTATVFGWEFRPVLGRAAVSAGTRQMLAVVAVPAQDEEAAQELELEVRTRSYWRRYHEERQTSSRKWHFWPFKVDGSNANTSDVHLLKVPNTAKIQQALAPKVSEISWVNCGTDRATVIVKGANFFSGTKVLIGGKVHREEDLNLTLKSDQALEFETSITSLAAGDSVLSGRFGSSLELRVPEEKLGPVKELSINRASIKPSRYTKAFRVTIDVKGTDGVNPQEFTTTSLKSLPVPILFVGTEPVPMPYDYTDVDPLAEPPATPGAAGGPPPGEAKFLRVQAWIPAKTLARSPSISFRVPFCGSAYQATQPLSFSEPTVTRMGGDDENSVFRIAHPLGFGASLAVELDRVYGEGSPELMKRSDVDYTFKVPTSIATRYQSLIVRIGTAEPYLLPLPSEEKPRPRTTVDTAGKPPKVGKGSLGPVEWSGTALDALTGATLFTNLPAVANEAAAGASPPASSPAQFTVYDGGKRVEVYFKSGSTEALGKAEMVFQTAEGDLVRAPLSIVPPEAAP